MSGKICLITGATAGIGLATARELASRGASVVGVGRDRTRCEHAAQSLRSKTRNSSVNYLTADLSSQVEVKRLVQEFRNYHNQLHVLVNNVGALFALRHESVDGYEMTLALNHIAPFLLTNLLLDTLKAGAPARIINVSSSAHDDVEHFDFDDPQAKSTSRRYGKSEFASLLYSLSMPWAHPAVVQYAQSKLANLLFTYELARRLAGTGVTVNAVHPGFVATKFGSGNGVLGWFMRIWSRLLGISKAEGAKTIVYLACSPAVEGITGQYFVKEKPVESSLASRNPDAASRLWEQTESWTSIARGSPS